jgi:hypothetical protein
MAADCAFRNDKIAESAITDRHRLAIPGSVPFAETSGSPATIFVQVSEDTTTASKGDDVITIADLEAVAAQIPDVLRVEARPAVQRGGDRLPDGSIQMPYFDYTPEALRLLSALGRHHVTVVFDWTSWQDEARAYLDPEKVATASLEDVRRLLTLHTRKGRFPERRHQLPP